MPRMVEEMRGDTARQFPHTHDTLPQISFIQYIPTQTIQYLDNTVHIYTDIDTNYLPPSPIPTPTAVEVVGTVSGLGSIDNLLQEIERLPSLTL